MHVVILYINFLNPTSAPSSFWTLPEIVWKPEMRQSSIPFSVLSSSAVLQPFHTQRNIGPLQQGQQTPGYVCALTRAGQWLGDAPPAVGTDELLTGAHTMVFSNRAARTSSPYTCTQERCLHGLPSNSTNTYRARVSFIHVMHQGWNRKQGERETLSGDQTTQRICLKSRSPCRIRQCCVLVRRLATLRIWPWPIINRARAYRSRNPIMAQVVPLMNWARIYLKTLTCFSHVALEFG